MGAAVTLVTPAVSVEPGQEATVEVRLRNTGAVVDEFTLDVLGDSTGWASVEPDTVSLFPGTEGSAKVVFRPPRASSTPSGPIPFGLRARSREDPVGSAVEEGVVEVGAFVEPYAELVPRTSRGSRSATHELALDNRGNARLSAEIQASDADRLLGFDVNPPAVVVEPGMAGFAKVRVKPAKRFWRGQPKSRSFQLFVTPEGRLPMTLDGTMLQEAVLPSWFGRLIAALILAAIAAIVLWLFVLKPTIESSVSDAVASPIADLRDDVNSALSGAGLPTMPADGAASPAAPTPTPDPGSSATAAPPSETPGVVIPGFGNPVDGRLDRNNLSYDPPGTLFVTDLVFSNPNAREGAIVILRNLVPILQVKLENIRDYDLHFVTPIVITDEQALNLSLSCTSDGPCDPAVFYSGYLRP